MATDSDSPPLEHEQASTTDPELDDVDIAPSITSSDLQSTANTDLKIETEEENADNTKAKSYKQRLFEFLTTYDFLIAVMLAIALAKAYPPLGAEYLKPDITATWIAVGIIFFLSGLGVRTDEFKKVAHRVYFNLYVHCFNFFLVSVFVFGLSRLLYTTNLLDKALADGLLICSALPMPVNVVMVLCAATGGDLAAAVFNSIVGNFVGIFLTPALILLYLGTFGDISLGEVFYMLIIRVVIPLLLGQLVQRASEAGRKFYATHRRFFKKFTEYCLVFIIYTVFCKTFSHEVEAGLSDVFIMIFFQLVILLVLMLCAWYSLRYLFRDDPELRVMGLFGCVQKTIALGIPVIASIYKGDPNQGLYTLPLLVYFPMQLILGSLMIPRLTKFIADERARVDAAKASLDDSVASADKEAAAGAGVTQPIPFTPTTDVEEGG